MHDTLQSGNLLYLQISRKMLENPESGCNCTRRKCIPRIPFKMPLSSLYKRLHFSKELRRFFSRFVKVEHASKFAKTRRLGTKTTVFNFRAWLVPLYFAVLLFSWSTRGPRILFFFFFFSSVNRVRRLTCSTAIEPEEGFQKGNRRRKKN